MFKRMLIILIIGVVIGVYVMRYFWPRWHGAGMKHSAIPTVYLSETLTDSKQPLVRLDDSGAPLDQPLLRYANVGKNITPPTTPLEGTVALTFDDGPSPLNTPKVLNILKKYNISATFFVVGKNVQKYPALVKAIIAGGHSIGCHGQQHQDLTTLTPAELREEVQGCVATLSTVLGVKPRCFRPPYNKTNARVTAYIESQGMRLQNDGLNTWDWENPGIHKIVRCTLCLVKPGLSIIMHDGQLGSENHAQTIYALPEIIRGIEKRGLHFEAIC